MTNKELAEAIEAAFKSAGRTHNVDTKMYEIVLNNYISLLEVQYERATTGDITYDPISIFGSPTNPVDREGNCEQPSISPHIPNENKIHPEWYGAGMSWNEKRKEGEKNEF